MYVIDHYYYNKLPFISTSILLQIHFHWIIYSFMILRYQIEMKYLENQSKLIREYEMCRVDFEPVISKSTPHHGSPGTSAGRVVEALTQTLCVRNLLVSFHFQKLISIDTKLRHIVIVVAQLYF